MVPEFGVIQDFILSPSLLPSPFPSFLSPPSLDLSLSFLPISILVSSLVIVLSSWWDSELWSEQPWVCLWGIVYIRLIKVVLFLGLVLQTEWKGGARWKPHPSLYAFWWWVPCDQLPRSPATRLDPQTMSQNKLVCKLCLSGYLTEATG